MIAITLITGCTEDSTTEVESEVIQSDGPIAWMNYFQKQKERYEGELPQPRELTERGHRIYFIHVDRAEDSGAALYFIGLIDIDRPKMFSTKASFIEALTHLESNAVVCYITPDVVPSPSISLYDLKVIHELLLKDGRQLIVYPGG